MGRLTWSLRAAADLEAIRDFIAQDSPRHAIVFVQRLVAFIGTIPKQPLLGSVVQEYKVPNLRERVFKGYRVIYRVADDRVQIVSLVHGTKPLPDTPPA